MVLGSAAQRGRRKWSHAAALCVALAALATTECGGITIDVTRSLAPQTIPGVPGNAPLEYSVSITMPPDAQANQAHRVELAALSFTITSGTQASGAPACWDFVDNVTVTMQSALAESTLPPVVIAVGMMPGCVQTFALTTDTSIDVRPYAIEGAVITADAVGHMPGETLTFDGQYVLAVHPF
jgi:hypothetical protein